MDISKRVYQRLRLIGYGTVPDFFCYSAEYRQQINRRTNPCPTPSHLPPLSKVRCCRPKKFERLPEGLLAPLRFAPHSYRPLSKVRCCRPKKFGRLPEELLAPLRFAPHSYRPLSKVRCCRRKKFGRLPEELPHQPSPRTNPSKNRTIPRKSPTPLLPLSKGGGLTARHKPLYCCFLLVPRPPFLFTKPFCRQDGGIASPPRFAPHSYRPLSKVRCCRRKKFGRLPEGLSHQPSQNRTIPFAFRVVRATAPLTAKIKSAPVFTGANSSSH